MNPLNELFHDFQPGRTRTEIVPGRSETVPGKFYILNPKIIPTLYSKRPTLNCTKPKTVLKPKTVPKLRGGRFLFRIWLSRRCLTCSEPLFIPNFEPFKIHYFHRHFLGCSQKMSGFKIFLHFCSRYCHGITMGYLGR